MARKTTWTSANISRCRQLKRGDTVQFRHKTDTYTSTVTECFLDCNGYDNRAPIKAILGTDDDRKICQFAAEAYGYAAPDGVWPESRKGDMAALTRMVKALFAYRPETAKAEAARLARMPANARRIHEYLEAHPGAYGCHRTGVIAVVEELLGVKF
jgi:hypothetical protein